MELASGLFNTLTSVASAGLTRISNALGGGGGGQPLPDRLSVQIVYATTTGTARRYAELVRKELFAMGLSGYWFDTTIIDAKDLTLDSVDELLEGSSSSSKGPLVFLIPSWTGGAWPESGSVLESEISDICSDFRYSADHLKHLRYAIFALGSSAYADAGNWARAGRELDEKLQSRQASPIAELGIGDDTADMDGAFKAWCEGALYPALCELYAQTYGSTDSDDEEGVGEEEGSSSSPCGCGSQHASCASTSEGAGAHGGHSNSASSDVGCCGGGGGGSSCACKAPSSSSSSSAAAPTAVGPEGIVDRRALRGQGVGYGDDGQLTLRQWRKIKRAEAEAKKAEADAAARAAARKAKAAAATTIAAAASAAPAAAAAVAARSSSSATAADDVTPALSAGGVELTEEDLLNDRLLAEADGNAVAVDSDSDSEPAGAGNSSSNGTGKKRSGASTGGAGVVSDVMGHGVGDLEDLGSAMAAAKLEKEAEAAVASGAKPPPEMLTPAQRKALTKEGYQLIGSHSAVKLCRWTKAQLRGRGGCYKHSGYGIQSYQCMEVTPSLACANKCVFCWRHHKNPVGKTWRWAVDGPEMIVEEAIAKHVAMVKQLKGMPGLKMDRYAEAFTVRHCALSLVGEPIMYPHINALLRILHGKRISTFLVNNGQQPEAIVALQPVTQLYVSVDAATKETLKAIDRPLFTDFWERFLASLDALRTKGQRTVYRVTLVKGEGGNMKDIDDYVALIKRGQPDFVEIKGVTWCGESAGSNLHMTNVPWHAEVKEFCEALAAKLDDVAPGVSYGLAVEHAHSCFVLLAKTSFKIDGAWHTHIDYERFHDLVARYYESGEPFSSMDYIARTPDWAVYDAPEAGFDPVEVRWRRKQDGSVAEVEYRPSGSGCG